MMRSRFLTVLLCGAVVCTLASWLQQRRPTVWMLGDSTMSIKERKAAPETGWGMAFAQFFDPGAVQIRNLAKNGRSTRTFISEKLWDSAANGMQSGDFVLIQFGHNDESKEKTDRYTTPDQYSANLRLFAQTALDKGAQPLLITPVSRRKFKNGQAVPTHVEYTALVKQVAAEMKLPCLDLDSSSMALYQQMGEANSKLLFLQLQAGEHPNYPQGKEDNTHFNELGARLVAQLVLAGMKAQQYPLANLVYVPAAK